MEGTEEAEATPLETLMDSTTLDEIQEDGAVGNGVEDGMEYAAGFWLLKRQKMRKPAAKKGRNTICCG